MAETRSYKVMEMDCADEVNTLQKALEKHEGIQELDFNILNARMTVLFEPEKIDSERIVECVAEAGMTAVPWEDRGTATAAGWWGNHGRLVMTILCGFLMLVGFFSHWVIHGSILQAFLTGAGENHKLPLIVVFCYGGAILAGAFYILPRALSAIRRLRPDMNVLMTVAVLGAIGIGEWLEAGMVVFLFSVALMLEHWSVDRARRAISALLELSPPTALVVPEEGGEPEERPVEAVSRGRQVVVRPGDRIPLDGQVLLGQSTVNQAPITGESVPVPKARGDQVYAGTINQRGTLEFEVTHPAGETTLANIIHMVEESRSRRAKSEKWIEKFARYYTPAMMALAAAVAIVPPLLVAAAWTPWFYRALVLLVIGCPCALVISTPVTIVSALTSAARNGVLIKGGIYLESAGRLNALALDKTGTLTYGQPRVQDVIPLDDHTSERLLRTAASVEADSTHPLADAIMQEAAREEIVAERAERFRNISGLGVEGVVDGQLFWVGSHRMMHDKGQESDQAHETALGIEDAGHTVVAVGTEDHVWGLISVADGLRENAAEVVGELKRLGVEHILMLTGDNEATARSIAEATGIDQWQAGLMPEDKVKAVKELSRRMEGVAMAGDGVNDAPAMAAADFGIAMGSIGSDVAIETADITLMSDEIAKVPWLVGHSRKALAIIKQNVALALGIKILFIILAVFGAATLWMAIAADMGVSLLVIFNGLRLLHQKQPEETPREVSGKVGKVHS
ncbi:MAG: cadmium-translocating P-type ATPase [Planctomycetes bacterium]|nr:cadmium-translocating P-type ATPase [Planctomycetota bacterium]